jgi:hypothetical protein
MTYKVEDPHADHPGYDARDCLLSHKVTARGPYGQILRAGFSCLATGGHCLPDQHCTTRRKREQDQRELEAQFAEARARNPQPIYPVEIL